jgi:hypothetical protein
MSADHNKFMRELKVEGEEEVYSNARGSERRRNGHTFSVLQQARREFCN